MMIHRVCYITLLMAAYFPLNAYCQVSIDISTTGIKNNQNYRINNGQQAENIEGVISGDVDIEGVTIINNQVYIDGVKIPHHIKKYKSAKTGRNYIIERGKNGNISIREF